MEKRVCIIGAGPSGITAAKHLLQVKHTNFVVYDKNSEVGGNWIYSEDETHSSVFESTHIISSKRFSQYHDYPMPDDFPDYPSHKQLKQYFQSYADHFGVTDYIEFNTEISKVTKKDDIWKVEIKDHDSQIFDYLIIAIGHHWNPKFPKFNGEFKGRLIHSHQYKTHLSFKNKRVLIVGGGNSGCDISVDVSRHALHTGISMRRGYYIVPKLIFGMPPDVLNSKSIFLPLWLRKRMFKLLLRFVVGKYENYGLQKPNHLPTESHPVLNSKILEHIRHGDIHPRVDIESIQGNTVNFKDGKSEDYDVIITATGYHIVFPFFEENILGVSEYEFPLYLNVFHPDHTNLALIGYTQPQGCIWPLSDTQSQLAANHVIGKYWFPKNISEKIEKVISKNNKKYLKSARHSTEVEYHSFQKQLFREVPKNAPEWDN